MNEIQALLKRITTVTCYLITSTIANIWPEQINNTIIESTVTSVGLDEIDSASRWL